MMNSTDRQFNSLYFNLLHRGHVKPSRTGHGTLMLPAQTMTFDCSNGQIPIFSARFVPTKSFMHEMLMFVSGTSSIKYLRDKKVGVWDSWFIKGTDVYDEPAAFPRSFERRLELAVLKGHRDSLLEFMLDALSRYPNQMGSFHINIPSETEGGTPIEYNNCPKVIQDELEVFLTSIGIPETFVAGNHTLTLAERADLAIAKGLAEQLNDYADFEMTRTQDGDSFAVTGIYLNPETDPWDFFQGEVNQLHAWLTDKGIPTEIQAHKPISLKRRLGRVSKNDAEKWDQINALLASPGFDDPMVDHVVEPGKVTVFANGAFVDIEVSALMGAAVWQLLDDLKVPAYELLDADIGAGSYAPQWRKWQDTQMVNYSDTALRNEYLKQGYVQKGYMYGDDGGNADDAFIMHREIDQLQNAIDMLKTNPDDRRIIVTAWNPGRTWQAALPPCHLYFQFTTWPMTLPELEATIRKHDKGSEYLRLAKDDNCVSWPESTNEDYFKYAMKFCEAAKLPVRNLSLTLVLRS